MRKELLSALGYSATAIRLLDEETHYGIIENPTVHVKHQAGCGDVLFLSLDLDGDLIRDAAFQCVGCSGLQSSASAMTEMIIGKRIPEIENLSMMYIVYCLGGIPENKYECAEAASVTLKKAIETWRENT
jgi:nitrogen fixation NifU-like protein